MVYPMTASQTCAWAQRFLSEDQQSWTVGAGWSHFFSVCQSQRLVWFPLGTRHGTVREACACLIPSIVIYLYLHPTSYLYNECHKFTSYQWSRSTLLFGFELRKNKKKSFQSIPLILNEKRRAKSLQTTNPMLFSSHLS